MFDVVYLVSMISFFMMILNSRVPHGLSPMYYLFVSVTILEVPE